MIVFLQFKVEICWIVITLLWFREEICCGAPLNPWNGGKEEKLLQWMIITNSPKKESNG